MLRGVATIGLLGFFLLQPGGIRQHHAQQVGGAGGAVDWAPESLFREQRQVAGVVDMPVAEDDGVEVYEITGPFFFGAAEMFKERLSQIAGKPRVLIVRMRHVPAIDSTGLHALRDLVRRSRREGTLVLLADVHAQPVVALERSGFLYEIGEENVLGNIDDALNAARRHMGLAPEPRPAFATPTVARETGAVP